MSSALFEIVPAGSDAGCCYRVDLVLSGNLDLSTVVGPGINLTITGNAVQVLVAGGGFSGACNQTKSLAVNNGGPCFVGGASPGCTYPSGTFLNSYAINTASLGNQTMFLCGGGAKTLQVAVTASVQGRSTIEMTAHMTGTLSWTVAVQSSSGCVA